VLGTGTGATGKLAVRLAIVVRPLPYSKNRNSELLQLFAQRLGVAGGGADEALSGLVSELASASKRTKPIADLEACLRKRNVRETRNVRGLSSDGYIEPLGSSYGEGFRITLREEASATRNRFTIAHELCHTFFYEIVPELKFGSHDTDPQEERLCNLGAGELLIPGRHLKSHAKKQPLSIDSLEGLSRTYLVSPEAMLLRLRSLRLWNCELSYWRLRGGNFSLERMIGGRRGNWKWGDESPLWRVLRNNETVSGSAYIELREPGSGLQLRPVCFQIAKRGDLIVALWSPKPIGRVSRSLPLFEVQQTGRARGQSRPSE
jgi:Zn-dependent peptidase ImmA (M78 family)